VSTVALTTVGSIVASGGLGNLLAHGVKNTFKAEIFAASLLCVVLALALDLVLLVVQRLLTPWARART
jgi:osmoprotectant transport system permease protein